MFAQFVKNTIAYSRESHQKAREELPQKGHVLHPISDTDKKQWMEQSKDVYKNLPDIPAEWVEEIHAKLKEMGKM